MKNLIQFLMIIGIYLIASCAPKIPNTTQEPANEDPILEPPVPQNNCLNFVDISQKTGIKIDGDVTSWQTKNGQSNVEHLAGKSTNGDLIVFYSSLQQDWQAVNVSQKTGIKIDANVTSWQTKNGQSNVEHLAGKSTNGDLIVFYWSPQKDWQAVNVSQKTGVKIDGDVTSWQTKNGQFNVEHLAGKSTNGDLIVFYWSPQKDWQAVNVSQKTGVKIDGDVTSWQTKNGQFNVEHLGGKSVNGDLTVFYWSPQKDWQAVNVSQKTGVKIDGDVTSWQTKNGSFNVEHLAGKSTNGDLTVFYWSPQKDWQAVNVSQKTGIKIEGLNNSYQRNIHVHKEEILVAKGLNRSLLLYWWTSDFDWQVINFTEISGFKTYSQPTAWLTGAGSSTVEHTAFQTNDNSLIAISNYDNYRKNKELILEPYYSLEKEVKVKKVVTILLDPQRPDNPALPKAQMESILFGSTNSVKDYYLENSDGKFTIQNEGVLGWYTTDEVPEYYWEPDPNVTCIDGWLKTHHKRYKEAIVKASKDFDFSIYDLNNDGVLHPNELGIVIIIPQNRYGGVNRTAVSQECPTKIPLVVQGVEFGPIAEIFIGNPPHLGISVHEISHLLLSAGDMYSRDSFPNAQIEFSPGGYSVMDQHFRSPHLDPYAKLKFGWLKPKIIYKSGYYNLRDIENNHEALILFDPSRAKKEFFIIENRWRGNSYDSRLIDQGIGVWHITEDPSLSRDWSRSAINFLRPFILQNSYNDLRSLWDSSDPSTGYDLVSNDTNINHPSLKWRDGSETGFAIRNFPVASNNMRIYIEVPWDCDYPGIQPPGPVVAVEEDLPIKISPPTIIPVSLKKGSHVIIELFDKDKKKRATIFEGWLPTGEHSIGWSKGKIPTGRYDYTITLEGNRETRKIEIME